jgi:hypothetical protein
MGAKPEMSILQGSAVGVGINLASRDRRAPRPARVRVGEVRARSYVLRGDARPGTT